MLFSGTTGESQLHGMIKAQLPGVRIEARVVDIVRDFGKVWLQELLEETASVMGRAGL